LKVCPSCHSRFVGGESFCPHDGQKLVDARELSPGELTGSELDDIVRLDRLVYADQYAERYTGRLLENRRAVYVTVLNQGYVPDGGATRRAETARAKGGNPLPTQVNTVLQLDLDKSPPYVIESEPRGPSIRHLLEERRTLDWDDSVRIVANLARVAQWLHDQGVPHTGFHPGSVYVTKLDEGHVEVGDWLLEAILAPDSPQRQLEENSASFVGYVDYMAPETIAASDHADIRSAVYSLGCLLYHMILGKPPLPAQTSAETLKRHQHEKPVKLGIAYGGAELPSDIDAILDMMLAKDPDQRFQAPMAVIGALSSLVDSTPDAIAPPLVRAETEDEDDLYRTIDMESVDREEVLGLNKSSEKPTIDLSTDEKRRLDEAADDSEPVAAGGAVSGTSETRDDGDGADEENLGPTHEMEPVPDGAAASEASESADDDATEVDVPSKKTLIGGLKMGGSISDRIRSGKDEAKKQPKKTLMTGAGLAAVRDEEDEDEDESPGGSKKTLMMGSGGGFDREASKSGIIKGKKIGRVESEAVDQSEAEAKADGDGEGDDPDSVQALDRSAISQELEIPMGEDEPVDGDAKPSDETVRVEIDAEKLDADAARSADRKRSPLAEEPSGATDDEDEPPADAKSDSSADEDDPKASAGDKKSIQMSPQDAEAVGLTDSEDIGFLDVDRDRTRDIDRSDWFASSTEDAWDASLAEEHEEKTEQRFRTILVAALGLIVVAAGGLFVYSEWIYTAEEATEEETAQATSDEPETDEVDLAALRTAFDESLESGRIVSPVGNSALHYLQQLKRHAADSAEYEEARETFVNTARDAATDADKAGDLRRARALAGYASQFAPEDEELKKMVSDLQARFTGRQDAGTRPAAADAGDDAAPADADPGGQEEEEKEKAEEPAKPEKIAKPTTPKKSTPPRKATSSKASAREDAKKARVAYTRGDIETARKLYHSALKKEPKNAEILFGLGKVYFDKSNYRQAVKYQTKAVRYNGSRNDYRIALGQSYYRLGKYKSAIGVWERVLERDPNNNVARQYVMLAKRKLER
jgi:serine/threonine protein kinase/tetratricopeptide (TPR) repeat protein